MDTEETEIIDPYPWLTELGLLAPDSKYCTQYGLRGIEMEALQVPYLPDSEEPDLSAVLPPEDYTPILEDPALRLADRIDPDGTQGMPGAKHGQMATLATLVNLFSDLEFMEILDGLVMEHVGYESYGEWLASDEFMAMNAKLLSVNQIDPNTAWCWNLLTSRAEPASKQSICWSMPL